MKKIIALTLALSSISSFASVDIPTGLPTEARCQYAINNTVMVFLNATKPLVGQISTAAPEEDMIDHGVGDTLVYTNDENGNPGVITDISNWTVRGVQKTPTDRRVYEFAVQTFIDPDGWCQVVTITPLRMYNGELKK